MILLKKSYYLHISWVILTCPQTNSRPASLALLGHRYKLLFLCFSSIIYVKPFQKCKISFPWQFWKVLTTISSVNSELLLGLFIVYPKLPITLRFLMNQSNQSIWDNCVERSSFFLASINHSICHVIECWEKDKNQSYLLYAPAYLAKVFRAS